MPTVNKALQALSEAQIQEVSVKYLMGWHDLEKLYGFRVKGLNHRRMNLGLPELTKEWSDEYRVTYIQSHFSEKEIRSAIFSYLLTHRVGDTRWTGIEILDCRFGREYARLFKILLGNHEYRRFSEMCRMTKLMETQHMNGGMGLSNPITKARAMETNLRKYGVENPMQRKDLNISSPFVQKSVQRKANDTRALKIHDAMVEFKKTGVWKGSPSMMSQAETIVFQCLVEKFGKEDVFYSYGLHPYDARYPFNCDFYIKSKDLFIEMNTHYGHGKHWYNPDNHDDVLRVQHLLESKSKRCHDAVRVWTETDVEKRRKAAESHLNYLVFWDGYYYQLDKKKYPRLSDFYEWFDTFACDYASFIQLHPENTY